MSQQDPFGAVLHRWIDIFMRRSMRNFIRYSRDSGLSMSQLGALFHLQREGSSAVSHLGDGLGVSSAAASQMLERLVQQGLILRTEDPNDRRVKQIALTDNGRMVLKESIRARQGWLDDLGGVMTDAEKQHVIEALEILIEKANRLQ